MKIADRLGLVVGMLVAVLLGLTAVAACSLVLLGSYVLAGVVAAGGLAAVLAVGAAYAIARDVEAAVPDLSAQLPVLPAAAPRKEGFRVREARPGEVPAPYLAAVMKGAEATRAALKARARQH